jgi:cobalt/nickel transport protein
MKSRRWIWIGLAVSLAIGALLSLAASPHPDGLERVAQDKGFLGKAVQTPVLASPLPDYLFPGIADSRLSAGLAGFLGTLALFALSYGIGWALRSARRRGA